MEKRGISRRAMGTLVCPLSGLDSKGLVFDRREEKRDQKMAGNCNCSMPTFLAGLNMGK